MNASANTIIGIKETWSKSPEEQGWELRSGSCSLSNEALQASIWATSHIVHLTSSNGKNFLSETVDQALPQREMSDTIDQPVPCGCVIDPFMRIALQHQLRFFPSSSL
ncbi:hypothetical protein P7K49_017601 [Saguinus oedipus]|uniref:Uncharacterized protein n=1 Tax=Saguinus oedipus TaxID=9490 RepID=A0ABQ9V371_SAGOE|nr:hypothetical protein P7K49_017601 [Saguinus oedipus]